MAAPIMRRLPEWREANLLVTASRNGYATLDHRVRTAGWSRMRRTRSDSGGRAWLPASASAWAAVDADRGVVLDEEDEAPREKSYGEVPRGVPLVAGVELAIDMVVWRLAESYVLCSHALCRA